MRLALCRRGSQRCARVWLVARPSTQPAVLFVKGWDAIEGELVDAQAVRMAVGV